VNEQTQQEYESHVAPKEWDLLPLFINGRWVAGEGPVLTVIDPSSEQVCAQVHGASGEQLNDAVTSARRSFDEGTWRCATRRDRAHSLDRLADAYERIQERLVEAIVSEAGTPITLARGMQVALPLAHLRAYANYALTDWTEPLGPHLGPVNSDSIVAYRPVGTVAAISAYNYPILLAMHKIGPALAAGCSTVLITSPQTPISALILAEAVAEADLPPGVLNIIVGDVSIAKALTESPLIDKVAFTGSLEVGRQVMRQAADGLRGVILELGGKSPAIIMPDADIATVVPELHLRYSRNAGQGCAAPTRLLVPRSKWDEFLEVSRATLSAIPVGSPWDPATVIGPLITSAHRERVERFVTEAVSSGATIGAGGGRPDIERGWYVNPTLVTDVESGARICQEEIFGPVAVALAFDDVDHAITIANDSKFGLHSYIYSSDVAGAIQMAERLRTGSVSINGGGGLRTDAPMGGFKASGVGREIGKWGMHEYLEPQHVQWQLAK
jgi:aldehyde dehydrogenase (NAD+)